jgi:hypothetical protein
MSLDEYLRSLPPDARIGSRKILRRPSFFKAGLTNTTARKHIKVERDLSSAFNVGEISSKRLDRLSREAPKTIWTIQTFCRGLGNS